MHKFIIGCFFLLTMNVFSQKENSKLDSIAIPVSIFITNDTREFNNQRIGNYLPLTGFKFMVNASVLDNYFQVNIRNIGRKITMDDINDNYQKAELNKYFFTGYDLRNIVWNRP